MNLRPLAALLVLAAARPAAADSHKLLVMQSEGRADATTRARIDAAIVKLARTTAPQATAGELSFSDAATAVGCKPDTAACKDEVLGMLAVDEIVITSVAPKPGGLEISVRRITRGGAARDATMLLATGTPPERLDGIAPLFADRPAPPPASITQAGPAEPAPAVPVVVPAPDAGAAPPPATPLGELPADRAQPVPPNQRLELMGMASGAGMIVVGAFLWGAARGVQTDINNAPTRTEDDLGRLRDLESKGDAYAAFGNVFVVGGAILGGISTYFYIRDRPAGRPPATQARVTPVVFDRGGGLVLTIGGMR